MKKTPEEYIREKGLYDYGIIKFNRAALIDFIQEYATQYHSDKLSEVAGKLPSGKDLINFMDPREFPLYDLDSYEKGGDDARNISASILAKKQKEVQEDAVGFAEWVEDNYFKCATSKLWYTYDVDIDKEMDLHGEILSPGFTIIQLYAIYKSETK